MAYFLDKLGDAQNAYNQLIASAYGRADTRVYTGPKMVSALMVAVVALSYIASYVVQH